MVKSRRCAGDVEQEWEPVHAIAHVAKLAPKLDQDQIILVNLSGRGDKDCVEVARLLGKHIG
jgi:tryptophan synthase beta chain